MWTFSITSTPLPSTPPSLRHDAVCGFASALAFLSRIGQAAGADIAIPWHGAVGLFLGVLITAPPACFYLVMANDWLAPFLAGWLWLVLEVWLTRGLHWDGAADLGDALGSGAKGKNFRAILKDSHMGAFGAMTLFLLMGGQALAAVAHFAASGPCAAATLVIAPAWARLGPAWLGYGGQAYGANSLGALICGHVSRPVWLWAWVQGLVFLAAPCLLGMHPIQAVLIFLGQTGLNLWFARLAARHGGLSGDFFGCHLETGQLLYLLLSIPACAQPFTAI